MKRLVFAHVVMLLAGSIAFAQGYRLQVGHFGLNNDGLTMDTAGNVPLPDGCMGQIIFPSDEPEFAPVTPDRARFDVSTTTISTAQRSSRGMFRINGGELFGVAGCFLANPGISGSDPADQSIVLRVWNAADPELATGYWESPLYLILPGFQQVSFRRDEWTYHAVDRRSERTGDDSPATVEDIAGIARNNGLIETWPNPFNSSTRIRISLDRTEQIQLRVYDVTGRLVRDLMNGPLSSGVHNLTFEAETLPAGLYFLSMQNGRDAPQVKRLLLVR